MVEIPCVCPIGFGVSHSHVGRGHYEAVKRDGVTRPSWVQDDPYDISIWVNWKAVARSLGGMLALQ